VDSKQDASLGIPTDAKYDIPLMFTAQYFTKKGAVTDESSEKASIYGDTWLVNGGIQPYLSVEPRKYRFRVLNAAASRTLNFTIDGGRSLARMDVIASDGGLRQTPASTDSLMVGMGERWEVRINPIVICFGKH
jgi:bilirubin oxidase